MSIDCKCGNMVDSKIEGKDSLIYEKKEIEHTVHKFNLFTFEFLDYNRTATITCEQCEKEVNIKV